MKVTIALVLCTACVCAQNHKDSAVDIARRVADRIIKDATFDIKTVDQRGVSDVQVIDYTQALPDLKGGPFYAFSLVTCDDNRKLNFGISFSEPLTIYINNHQVYQSNRKRSFQFQEVAYSIFNFNDTFSSALAKGTNTICIESGSTNPSFIYLRELTEAEQPVHTSFLPLDSNCTSYTWPWSFAGGRKFSLNELQTVFAGGRAPVTTLVPPLSKKTERLAIAPLAAFGEDSYVEWNYANGETLLSLCTLTEECGDARYEAFVQKCCDFTVTHLPDFERQYSLGHDLRAPDYRIFRKAMLDDAGAPVLPYIGLTLAVHSQRTRRTQAYDSLIQVMTNYVMNKQWRLADGTFCRPEPRKWTVWADDLFMSVPLLVRMGKRTSNSELYKESINQILRFNQHLFVPNVGLYKHGWYSWSNTKSGVYWGRANGWVAWATSEALLYAPHDFPSYERAKQLFVNHLLGVLKFQGSNGMWHQILDDSTSFEETSCTAMFTLALSRAILCHWIDRKYFENVERAWSALRKQIDEDGIVTGICQGTGISESAEDYKTRKTFKNDPRGLGAVITAAVEYDRLRRYLLEGRDSN